MLARKRRFDVEKEFEKNVRQISRLSGKSKREIKDDIKKLDRLLFGKDKSYDRS